MHISKQQFSRVAFPEQLLFDTFSGTTIYRLLKYADARHILFLVDTKNLGEQAEQEMCPMCRSMMPPKKSTPQNWRSQKRRCPWCITKKFRWNSSISSLSTNVTAPSTVISSFSVDYFFKFCGCRKLTILRSPNRGDFLRLPMSEINCPIRLRANRCSVKMPCCGQINPETLLSLFQILPEADSYNKCNFLN